MPEQLQQSDPETSGEHQVPQHEVVSFDSNQELSEREQKDQDEYLELRKTMMEQWGWMTYGQKETDRNEYDEPEARTRTFLSKNQQGELQAGLRATPFSIYDLRVACEEESNDDLPLSVRMWGKAQHEVGQKLAEKLSDFGLPLETPTFDITRWVNKGAFTIGPLFEVAGRAIAERNGLWLFMAQQKIVDFFDQLGLKSIAIHTGRVSENDKVESTLGIMPDAFEAWQEMAAHPQGSKLWQLCSESMSRGFDSSDEYKRMT